MKCVYCGTKADNILHERKGIQFTQPAFLRKPPVKIAVCFDCQLERRGCLRAWQNNQICVCHICKKE